MSRVMHASRAATDAGRVLVHVVDATANPTESVFMLVSPAEARAFASELLTASDAADGGQTFVTENV